MICRHVYKKCNANDGVIFTPEQYDFRPGPCYGMLKWKWPEKLTLDFALTRPSGAGALDDRYRLHFIDNRANTFFKESTCWGRVWD